MPLKGVQSWVNGWVNINNRHVLFSDEVQGRNQGEAGVVAGASEEAPAEHDCEQKRRSGNLPLHEQPHPGVLSDASASDSRRRRHRQPQPPAAVVGDGRAILQRRGHDPQRIEERTSYGGEASRLAHGCGHDASPSSCPPRQVTENGVTSSYAKAVSRVRKKATSSLVKQVSDPTTVTIATTALTSLPTDTVGEALTASFPESSGILKEGQSHYEPIKGDSRLSSDRTTVHGEVGKRSARRINTRRLRRSNSQSDLVRQMASDKDCAGGARRSNLTSSSSSGGSKSYRPQTGGKAAHRLSDASGSLTVRHTNVVTAEELDSLASSVGHVDSVRWVADFFAGEQPEKHQHPQKQAQKRSYQPQLHQDTMSRGPTGNSVTTGQYLNEAAFEQARQRQKQLSGSGKLRASGHVSVESGQSSGSRHDGRRKEGVSGSSLGHACGVRTQQHPQYNQQPQQQPEEIMNDANHGGTDNSVQAGTPSVNADAREKQPYPHSHHYHYPGPPTIGSHPPSDAALPHCPCCEDMERRLLFTQADLDYLRTAVLQNEFICSECENHRTGGSAVLFSSAHSVSSGTSSRRRKDRDREAMIVSSAAKAATTRNQESAAMYEASQRLVEVTARHKRQIEEMTKERARWQNDMHLKLSKFAMMCKDLNEESAKRKEDAMSLLAELEDVKTERNALASEIQTLRAQVELHSKEESENANLREMVQRLDNEALDRVDDAVGQRDAIIKELSSRLERTLDTLEIERQQQRQRRQIIFPVSRQHGGASDEWQAVNAELVKARDAARVARLSLDAAKADAVRREESLQVRCDELTRELQAAERKLAQSSVGETAGMGSS